jgi:hypothetical protein
MTRPRTRRRVSAFSREYRPATYWPAHTDLTHQLLTTVKGVNRRHMIQELLATGDLDPEDPQHSLLLTAVLDPASRHALAGVHPSCMGGEYLDDRADGEVEIGRVTLASTLSDVVAIYARRDEVQPGRIHYRVVDEYEGDTLDGPPSCTADGPLTLGELVNHLLQAWHLVACLHANEPPDLQEALAFFRAESEFYPGLDRELRRVVRQQWPDDDDDED